MSDSDHLTVMGPDLEDESDKYDDMREAPRFISCSTEKVCNSDELRTWAEITVSQMVSDPEKPG